MPDIQPEITWKVSQRGSAENRPKLPYVGTWPTFSKLPEDEKLRIFNNIRAELITSERMENK